VSGEFHSIISDLIITQIGRENNISAETCKYTCEKERKSFAFSKVFEDPRNFFQKVSWWVLRAKP